MPSRAAEPDPPVESGCTLTEATNALACAHSVDLAVQAKREIGRLWEDVSRSPRISRHLQRRSDGNAPLAGG